ncbi:hypothetical protein V6N11_001157 [Hibiscus sabdariffa]|uniref:Uncharacterized protein n=1 Tax=Hibiscus sabdariffa TaxID=183260 RepID=A0ABR2RYX3_9ROSI
MLRGLGSKTIVSAVRKRVFSQKVELLLLLETKKVSISEDGIQKKWLVKCKGVFVVDSAVNGGFVDIEISKASQDEMRGMDSKFVGWWEKSWSVMEKDRPSAKPDR